MNFWTVEGFADEGSVILNPNHRRPLIKAIETRRIVGEFDANCHIPAERGLSDVERH